MSKRNHKRDVHRRLRRQARIVRSWVARGMGPRAQPWIDSAAYWSARWLAHAAGMAQSKGLTSPGEQ